VNSRKFIDGESWASPPSIGDDEYRAGGITGPLNVANLAETYVAAGFGLDFAGHRSQRTEAIAD